MVFFAIVLLVGCNTDDDQLDFSSLLPYNPDKHLYGTIQFPVGNTWEAWEVVIDPSSGRLDTLAGTKVSGGSFSYPVGTKNLTAFGRNQRIYLDIEERLVVQDLETGEKTMIELRDAGTSESVIFPQYLRFGTNEDELFLIDTDKTVWSIDLLSETVEKTSTRLPVPEGGNLSNVFYLPVLDHFLFSSNSTAFNAGTVTDLLLYDLSTGTITNSMTIPESFGLAQDAGGDGFYFLQIPGEDTGFRLMEFRINAGQMELIQLSDADLPIDELSLYAQTIHTATNSYICRGGSNSIEMPSNTLYSIDLDSGNLTDEVVLEEDGILLKLVGE